MIERVRIPEHFRVQQGSETKRWFPFLWRSGFGNYGCWHVFRVGLFLQPDKKLWIPPFHPKPGADEARRRRISFMDLRLRSNEVAARFSMKPFGLRSFWLCALSLLGHRSVRICSLVASRTKPKILSAAVFIVF
jgi:hypothetical protein